MGARSPRGRRPRHQRQRHQRLLVVCGGRITEPAYLDHVSAQLGASGVTIEVAKSGRDPESLVVEAGRRRREDIERARRDTDNGNTYDSVWVVFDVDDFARQIPTAIKLAADEGVSCIISNPCFEIWLLWHVRDTGAYCATGDAQSQAIANGVVRGSGGKQIAADVLTGQYGRARERALRAARSHVDAGRTFPSDNPRSDIYLLVDHILDTVRQAKPDQQIGL